MKRGIKCDVVATTLIPKRAGELTAVWVPDTQHEAIRELVRCRETAVEDRTRAFNRLGKLVEIVSLAANNALRPDLLWLSQSPTSHALVEVIEAERFVCRMSDRCDLFENVHPSMRPAELRLIERADGALVMARSLFEAVPPQLRDKVVYLPNEVDTAHSRGPLQNPKSWLPSLARAWSSLACLAAGSTWAFSQSLRTAAPISILH